jgi:hypothetical protein
MTANTPRFEQRLDPVHEMPIRALVSRPRSQYAGRQCDYHYPQAIHRSIMQHQSGLAQSLFRLEFSARRWTVAYVRAKGAPAKQQTNH